MSTRESFAPDLQRLGVQPGDLVMVHASLTATGPVLDAVGPAGTLMGYASWNRSPYEETLNGARMDEGLRHRWTPFDRATSHIYRGFGLLNQFLVQAPGARRSRHPDASMVEIGPLADTLIEPHDLGHAFGPGSPLERFVAHRGKVLLLGAPLDSDTVLHYAEAVAHIPNKRRVTYEMPLRNEQGGVRWEAAEDFDSNGILDCFAVDGQPDAIETIARAYVEQGRHREGAVGCASCYLFEARNIVSFGVDYLEMHFGSA